MNASKRKGTAAETAVVNYLRKSPSFSRAERRALAGVNDKGDIAGIEKVVLEVKNTKALALAEWMKELEVEVGCAEAEVGAVIAKKRGTTNVGDWYAILPVRDLLFLLVRAGYGERRYER